MKKIDAHLHLAKVLAGYCRRGELRAIGGVSLLGGEGTVPGAIFGAVLMGLLNNGLNLMSVPSTHAGLVKGLVIVVAVAFDAMQHADQSRKKVKKVKKASA